MEPCTTDQGFLYRLPGKEPRWPVRLLSRPGGHSGMSGGWRSVAIDHVGGDIKFKDACSVKDACSMNCTCSGMHVCYLAAQPVRVMRSLMNDVMQCCAAVTQSLLLQSTVCRCNLVLFPLRCDAAEFSQNVSAVTHRLLLSIPDLLDSAVWSSV